MKLLFVSENKEVIARWACLAKNWDYTFELLVSDQLSLPAGMENSVGFLHVSSIPARNVARLISSFPEVKWVIFSDTPNDVEGLRYLETGARGYINTYVTDSVCLELLDVVNRNDIWAGPSITRLLLNQYLSGRPAPKRIEPSQDSENSYPDLTRREEMVMRAIMTGAGNKEIARDLGITERTVKAHVASILRKTDCKDRVSLIIKFPNQVA